MSCMNPECKTNSYASRIASRPSDTDPPLARTRPKISRPRTSWSMSSSSSHSPTSESSRSRSSRRLRKLRALELCEPVAGHLVTPFLAMNWAIRSWLDIFVSLSGAVLGAHEKHTPKIGLQESCQLKAKRYQKNINCKFPWACLQTRLRR